jgi:hypothetical protein
MNFIPGSKYEENINNIVKFTKLEIKFFDEDFSKGYKKFKEEHLYHVNMPASCYKCLKPINGKSLVIEEQNDKITYSTYYFHETCFDGLVKK